MAVEVMPQLKLQVHYRLEVLLTAHETSLHIEIVIENLQRKFWFIMLYLEVCKLAIDCQIDKLLFNNGSHNILNNKL